MHGLYENLWIRTLVIPISNVWNECIVRIFIFNTSIDAVKKQVNKTTLRANERVMDKFFDELFDSRKERRK